ncbi:MAG: alpha/beta fold hydrolase, partial [Pseudomonadota bacterium]
QALAPMSDRIAQDTNPAFLLNAAGDVIARNVSGDAFFGSKQPLSLTDVFSSAAISSDKASELLGRLKRADSHGEVIGFFHAFGLEHGQRVFMALLSAQCPVDQRVHALLRTLSPSTNVQTESVVQNQFDLTDAEMSILGNLVRGQTLKEISQVRRTSIHTVRTQVKLILEKTGFTSQIDLVRHMCFLHSFEPPHSELDVPPHRSAQDSAKSWHSLRLMNGQVLDYAMLGPKTGQPVLYLHGMIDALDFPPDFQSLLREQDILLIAPIRPHYSVSTLDPGSADMCAFFADCLLELLDHLSIQQIVVCGHMAGTVYGFEFGNRYPDRTIGLVSVAGAVPMTKHWQFSEMSKGHRVSGLTARHSPKLLNMITRGAIRVLKSGREDFMLNLFLRDSLADRLLAQRDVFREILLKRFRFITAQGEAAFVNDIQLVSNDWADRVTNFQMPVTFVHGEEDRVVLFRGVESFASQFDRSKIVPISGAGQLLLFTHAHDVLGEIGQMAERTHTVDLPVLKSLSEPVRNGG